jgi:integrase
MVGFYDFQKLLNFALYRSFRVTLVIQAILRHKNPNTTAKYLRTLGLEQTREALEEGLKGPAQVIQFEQIARKQVSGNN